MTANIFSVEDTSEKCYRDITSSLIRRGLKMVPHRKKSKLDKRRSLPRDKPAFIWCLNEKDIDFQDIDENAFQVCNHFEGTAKILTTKMGFCDLLHDMRHTCNDSHEISPRCYNLGNPVHRDEFIEDFKITAAISIIKWSMYLELVRMKSFSTNIPIIDIEESILDSAVAACESFLRLKSTGSEEIGKKKKSKSVKKSSLSTKIKTVKEKPLFNRTINNSLVSTGSYVVAADNSEISILPNTLSLTDNEWQLILLKSYTLAALIQNDDDNDNYNYNSNININRNNHNIYRNVSNNNSNDDDDNYDRINSYSDDNYNANNNKKNAADDDDDNKSIDYCNYHNNISNFGNKNNDDVSFIQRQNDNKRSNNKNNNKNDNKNESKNQSHIYNNINTINLNNIIKYENQFIQLLNVKSIKLLLLLKKLQLYHKQFDIDGFQNIWIVKAPDASRGLGMNILYKLNEILECEKNLSCRTVQKYIENPLLDYQLDNSLYSTNFDISNIYDNSNKYNNKINNNNNKCRQTILNHKNENMKNFKIISEGLKKNFRNRFFERFTELNDKNINLSDVSRKNDNNDHTSYNDHSYNHNSSNNNNSDDNNDYDNNDNNNNDNNDSSKSNNNNYYNNTSSKSDNNYKNDNRSSKSYNDNNSSKSSNNNNNNNNHHSYIDNNNDNGYNYRDNNIRKIKFDLRVWVLVTSFEPGNLIAFIYTAVYGRRCSVPYTSNVQNLDDNFGHLTNYSLQKKSIPIGIVDERIVVNPMLTSVGKAYSNPLSVVRSLRNMTVGKSNIKNLKNLRIKIKEEKGMDMAQWMNKSDNKNKDGNDNVNKNDNTHKNINKDEHDNEKFSPHSVTAPFSSSSTSCKIQDSSKAFRKLPHAPPVRRPMSASYASTSNTTFFSNSTSKYYDISSDSRLDPGSDLLIYHDELVQTVNSHLSDRFTKNSNTPTDNNKHSIQKERNSKIIYEDNSSQEIENRNEYKNENKNENGSNECTGRDLETKEEKGRNMKNDCSKTTNNKEAKNVLPNVPSWESSIWPEIKRKIFATLEAAQTSIVHRPGTFEFLGYDILIDANGVPWILEVNMSPALAHRSTQQNAVIANMSDGLVEIALNLLPSCPPESPPLPSTSSLPLSSTQDTVLVPSNTTAINQSTSHKKQVKGKKRKNRRTDKLTSRSHVNAKNKTSSSPNRNLLSKNILSAGPEEYSGDDMDLYEDPEDGFEEDEEEGEGDENKEGEGGEKKEGDRDEKKEEKREEGEKKEGEGDEKKEEDGEGEAKKEGEEKKVGEGDEKKEGEGDEKKEGDNDGMKEEKGEGEEKKVEEAKEEGEEGEKKEGEGDEKKEGYEEEKAEGDEKEEGDGDVMKEEKGEGEGKKEGEGEAMKEGEGEAKKEGEEGEKKEGDGEAKKEGEEGEKKEGDEEEKAEGVGEVMEKQEDELKGREVEKKLGKEGESKIEKTNKEESTLEREGQEQGQKESQAGDGRESGREGQGEDEGQSVILAFTLGRWELLTAPYTDCTHHTARKNSTFKGEMVIRGMEGTDADNDNGTYNNDSNDNDDFDNDNNNKNDENRSDSTNMIKNTNLVNSIDKNIPLDQLGNKIEYQLIEMEKSHKIDKLLIEIQNRSKSGLVVDKNFSLQGCSISLNNISTVDSYFGKISSLLSIQSWFRLYLTRIRTYHMLRMRAVLTIQKNFRGLRGRKYFIHCRRSFKAQILQNSYRSYTARMKLTIKKKEKAAIKIQCLVRTVIARTKRNLLFRTAKIKQIMFWYKSLKNILRRKASFKLVRFFRPMIRKQLRRLRIIFHLINLNYRRRKRNSTIIKRWMKRWWEELSEKKRMKKYISRCRLLAVAASTYVLQRNILKNSVAALEVIREKAREIEIGTETETEKKKEDTLIEEKKQIKIEKQENIRENLEIKIIESKDPGSIQQNGGLEGKAKEASMTIESLSLSSSYPLSEDKYASTDQLKSINLINNSNLVVNNNNNSHINDKNNINNNDNDINNNDNNDLNNNNNNDDNNNHNNNDNKDNDNGNNNNNDNYDSSNNDNKNNNNNDNNDINYDTSDNNSNDNHNGNNHDNNDNNNNSDNKNYDNDNGNNDDDNNDNNNNHINDDSYDKSNTNNHINDNNNNNNNGNYNDNKNNNNYNNDKNSNNNNDNNNNDDNNNNTDDSDSINTDSNNKTHNDNYDKNSSNIDNSNKNNNNYYNKNENNFSCNSPSKLLLHQINEKRKKSNENNFDLNSFLSIYDPMESKNQQNNSFQTEIEKKEEEEELKFPDKEIRKETSDKARENYLELSARMRSKVFETMQMMGIEMEEYCDKSRYKNNNKKKELYSNFEKYQKEVEMQSDSIIKEINRKNNDNNNDKNNYNDNDNNNDKMMKKNENYENGLFHRKFMTTKSYKFQKIYDTDNYLKSTISTDKREESINKSINTKIKKVTDVKIKGKCVETEKEKNKEKGEEKDEENDKNDNKTSEDLKINFTDFSTVEIEMKKKKKKKKKMKSNNTLLYSIKGDHKNRVRKKSVKSTEANETICPIMKKNILTFRYGEKNVRAISTDISNYPEIGSSSKIISLTSPKIENKNNSKLFPWFE